MYLPGQEGKMAVMQKAKFIAHAGCAEASLMILFLMQTKHGCLLLGSN